MRVAFLTTVAAATLSLSVAALAQTSSGSAGGAAGGGTSATTSGGASGGTMGATGSGGASGSATGSQQMRPPSAAGGTASSSTGGAQQQGSSASKQEQDSRSTASGQQQGTGAASSAQRQQGTSGGQQGAAGTASTNQPDRAATTGSTSINLTSEQRTHVTRAFSTVNVQPLTNVSFSVSVGETIPTSVTTLHACPGEVVRYLDGLTECRFVIVNNRIVIVEPSSRRIVTIIERTG
jgi:hypothetical protein